MRKCRNASIVVGCDDPCTVVLYNFTSVGVDLDSSDETFEIRRDHNISDETIIQQLDILSAEAMTPSPRNTTALSISDWTLNMGALSFKGENDLLRSYEYYQKVYGLFALPKYSYLRPPAVNMLEHGLLISARRGMRQVICPASKISYLLETSDTSPLSSSSSATKIFPHILAVDQPGSPAKPGQGSQRKGLGCLLHISKSAKLRVNIGTLLLLSLSPAESSTAALILQLPAFKESMRPATTPSQYYEYTALAEIGDSLQILGDACRSAVGRAKQEPSSVESDDLFWTSFEQVWRKYEFLPRLLVPSNDL